MLRGIDRAALVVVACLANFDGHTYAVGIWVSTFGSRRDDEAAMGGQLSGIGRLSSRPATYAITLAIGIR